MKIRVLFVILLALEKYVSAAPPADTRSNVATSIGAVNGAIHFSSRTYPVVEEAGSVNVEITRTASEGTATVVVTASDGVARASNDYVLRPTVVTFPPGDSSETVTVIITDDNQSEEVESLILTLQTPTGGAVIGEPGSATIIIRDEELDPANAVAIIGDSLVRFSTADPQNLVSSTAVTGLSIDEQLVGLDVRPSTGQLYAISNIGRLYTINSSSGIATAVSSPGAFMLNGNIFGMDFDPTTNLISVTSDAAQYIRLDPDTGMPVGQAALLTYRAGDPSAGVAPVVTAIAYSNSLARATVTGLWGFDAATDRVVRWESPSSGMLETVGEGLGFDLSPDASFDSRDRTSLGLMVTNTSTVRAQLFFVDRGFGRIIPIGPVGDGSRAVRAFAMIPNGTIVFSTSSYSVSEGANSVGIPVHRIGGTDGTVNVRFVTSDVTATAPYDYIDADVEMSFGPGVTFLSPLIPILNAD